MLKVGASMKKLIVLSHGRVTGQNLARELKKIFGRLVDIKPYSSEDELPDDYRDNLILVTTDAVLSGPFRAFIDDSPHWMMAQRVINYKYLRPVIELPEGTEVLLVNDHERTTNVAMDQLKGLGLNHIKYVPYFPGCRLKKAYDIAITPGEPHLVPASVKHVIDIETRQIDLTTIIEIADRLGILTTLKSTLSSQYLSDFVELLQQLNAKAKEAESLQNSFMTLADNSNDGIVYTDSKGRIMLMNRSAKQYFPHAEIIGKNIGNILPAIEKVRLKKEKREILRLNGQDVFVSLKNVNMDDEYSEQIYLFEDVSELRKLEHEVRRKSRKIEHVAKYKFEDILYKSEEMKQTIELAKKISKSESTVLIEGESGTGKELLAQAIHLYSHKAEGPFVPVNFAALPFNLLESELFGYEEGSFTGAQKGGKPGLFEEAHGGTLFLDEIGDAPMEFQVRLLRVLQEKQIRRVGGRKLIPINIRVIAATNRNLIQEVKKGTFREDLFYRISVLPLSVPSLRNRREDIQYLMSHFLKEFHEDKSIQLDTFMSPETIHYLTAYRWPGNIRQLINVMEYLSNIYEGTEAVDKTKLPLYMQSEKSDDGKDLIKRLIGDDLLWIMVQIDRNGHIGRRQLTEIAESVDKKLSEGRIRTLMNMAENLGLIKRDQGRKGSSLTSRGMELIDLS